jgi:ABC-type multidrug transport system permease subunit
MWFRQGIGYRMKALTIARKTVLELWREPLTLVLLLGFPIMLIVLYYVAYGETDQGLAKYLSVLVINEDEGTGLTEGEAGAGLVQMMREVTFDGRPVFDLSPVADRRAAEITLRERKAALLLAIPPGFSKSLAGAAAGGPAANLFLVGDPHTDSYIFARSLLGGLVQEFAQLESERGDDLVSVSYEFVPGTGTMSDFEFGVPGVIVFGVMFVAITTAQLMVQENVRGTLRRLRLTRVRSSDLLLGVTLAQMVVALVMVPAVFGVAAALGFRSQGSLPLAMGVGLLLSLSAVGVGLITACFARNDGEAANLSATIGVLMVLVSGAMYPMPELPMMSIAGRTIQVYDLFPTAHAAEAMRRVLLLGDGLPALGYEVSALVVLSLVILAVGVGLYQRLQLRKM